MTNDRVSRTKTLFMPRDNPVEHLGLSGPVEVHTTVGHVIAGTVSWVMLRPDGTTPYAVSIQESLPTGEHSYERIVLMDHVFEIRPLASPEG